MPPRLEDMVFTQEDIDEFDRADAIRWEKFGLPNGQQEFNDFYRQFGPTLYGGIGHYRGKEFLNITFLDWLGDKSVIPTEYKGFPVELRFHDSIPEIIGQMKGLMKDCRKYDRQVLLIRRLEIVVIENRFEDGEREIELYGGTTEYRERIRERWSC